MTFASSIPAYARGVQRQGGKIIGLTLNVRKSAPTSRPSKTNDRHVGATVYVDNGAVVIRADGMSRLTFEPGALQSALRDLEPAELARLGSSAHAEEREAQTGQALD